MEAVYLVEVLVIVVVLGGRRVLWLHKAAHLRRDAIALLASAGFEDRTEFVVKLVEADVDRLGPGRCWDRLRRARCLKRVARDAVPVFRRKRARRHPAVIPAAVVVDVVIEPTRTDVAVEPLVDQLVADLVSAPGAPAGGGATLLAA